MPEFEFDRNKSTINLQKHGIDFETAQKLWNDEDLIEIPAKKIGAEVRSIFVGQYNGKHWSAVATYRGSKIRIISVRRSRDREVGYYDYCRRI